MSNCPICGGQEQPHGTKRLMDKYDVEYFLCRGCLFFHTEEPYWLEESYSDAIVSTDTGIVQRNLAASATASAMFRWMFGGRGSYLDVAGGYGLFTRLMRDFGFDCYWFDPYAANLFARGYGVAAPFEPRYRAATAFEVMEHVPQPLSFVEGIFRTTGCEALLFSTELYGQAEPPPAWHYYALNSGQHISFFHRTTLAAIARRLQLRLNSHGIYHMLSRRGLNAALFGLLTSRIACKVVPLVNSALFPSRLQSDHLALMDQSRSRQGP